jgi:CheY-like chemotaxis protein
MLRYFAPRLDWWSWNVPNLTSTISWLEMFWVVAAAVGFGAMIVLTTQSWRRIHWLQLEGQNGVLRGQAYHNLDKSLLLLLVTELYLVAGVSAMVVPPSQTPAITWSPAWTVGLGLVGALAFTLWLAALLVRHDRYIARLLAAQTRETMPADPTRPRLLLIDDYALGRKAMKLGLEAAGYEVVERPDARGLLGTVARYRPSLIIMDLNLPGVTGDTAAQALRALGDETPLILHTGQWPSAVVPNLDTWAQAIGVQAVLVKGSDTRPLQAMVHEVSRWVPRPEVPP